MNSTANTSIVTACAEAPLYSQPHRAIFPDKESYLAFRDAWRKTCKESRTILRPEHYALYAALRGRDWRKGFTPCTCPRKLDNGHRKWRGLEQTLSTLSFARRRDNFQQLTTPFQGAVSDCALAAIIDLILDQGKELAGN